MGKRKQRRQAAMARLYSNSPYPEYPSLPVDVETNWCPFTLTTAFAQVVSTLDLDLKITDLNYDGSPYKPMLHQSYVMDCPRPLVVVNFATKEKAVLFKLFNDDILMEPVSEWYQAHKLRGEEMNAKHNERNRSQLSSLVSRVSPNQTPFIQMIQAKVQAATQHEWQVNKV